MGRNNKRCWRSEDVDSTSTKNHGAKARKLGGSCKESEEASGFTVEADSRLRTTELRSEREWKRKREANKNDGLEGWGKSGEEEPRTYVLKLATINNISACRDVKSKWWGRVNFFSPSLFILQYTITVLLDLMGRYFVRGARVIEQC